jgi:hypothetical protein
LGVAQPIARSSGPAAWVVAATPEILAAGACAVAWIAPTALSPAFIRGLMLGLLVEFLVIHSFAFLMVAAAPGSKTPRWGRILAVLGFGAFYLLFAGLMAKIFDNSAPLWTFAWLLGSRILTIVVDRAPTGREGERQMHAWGMSAFVYIVGMVLTQIVPVPRLGLTPEVVASLGIPGSGSWPEEPQRAMVFGLLYFGLRAYDELRQSKKYAD